METHRVSSEYLHLLPPSSSWPPSWFVAEQPWMYQRPKKRHLGDRERDALDPPCENLGDNRAVRRQSMPPICELERVILVVWLLIAAIFLAPPIFLFAAFASSSLNSRRHHEGRRAATWLSATFLSLGATFLAVGLLVGWQPPAREWVLIARVAVGSVAAIVLLGWLWDRRLDRRDPYPKI